MKKRILLIFIILILLCVNSITQRQQKPKIGFNGYDWEEFDTPTKLGYFPGLQHGFLVATREFIREVRKHQLLTEDEIQKIKEAFEKKFYFWGATYGQMVEGVDELYKDYSNKTITIHSLVTLVCKRVGGKLSSEDMEKELQKLRAEVLKEN